MAYCCSRGLLLASVVGQAHCCVCVRTRINTAPFGTAPGCAKIRQVQANCSIDQAIEVRVGDHQGLGVDHAVICHADVEGRTSPRTQWRCEVAVSLGPASRVGLCPSRVPRRIRKRDCSSDNPNTPGDYSSCVPDSVGACPGDTDTAALRHGAKETRL